MINTGSLLRVDRGDGRGRYAAAWWEWDCGLREGSEIVAGITERQQKKPAVKEKKERRRNALERNVNDDGEGGSILGDQSSRVVPDTQVEDSQVENQVKTREEDVDDGEQMAIDE